MIKLDGNKAVLAPNGKEIGHFRLDNDGSYYFWANEESTGCWSAQELKDVADLLDQVNKPCEEVVNDYFEQEESDFIERARVEYRKLLNESGMFFEFYPQLSGDWKKDREEWLKEYSKLEHLRADFNHF